jgi:hypothetical protein
MALRSTDCSGNEYQVHFLGGGGVKAAGAYGDNLTTCMCRLSGNLGATSWDSEGLSRPVQGLLYLLYLICSFMEDNDEWKER